MKKNTKRWLTLGISSLILLAGVGFMPNHQASASQIKVNRQPHVTLTRRRPRHRAYQKIGHYTNQHKYFVGLGVNKNYREFSYLTNHQVNNLYHYKNANHFVYDGDFTIFHNTNITNQIPRMHLTRYLNLGGQKLYHAYGNNRKVRNIWILNHMLSNHRRTAHFHHSRSTLLKYKKGFTNIQEYRYAKHYLTKSQYSKYRNLKRTYDNLVKYHNYSGKNRSRCNRDLGEWINFYRKIHHLPSISYNPDLSYSTEDALKDNTYPNILGLSDVPQLIEDGMTDSNNTNYGITPDRNVILSPSNSEFGGYIFPNGNGNFSSGIDFNQDNNVNKSVVYPSANIASLGDAYYGKYWSYRLPSNYNDDIDTPHISVYDCTNHKRVHVSQVHVINNEVYYSVNIRKLDLFHTYRIHFSGGNIPNKTYKTTLVDFGDLDGFDGYYDQFY